LKVEDSLTYSIVARDKETGELGVAVQSHWFSVGSVVTWARAGVGAVATQAMAEISYGPLGLELMSSGKTANEALEALLKSDSKSETRQVAFVDSKGNVSVHTGKKCIPYAGHVKGDQFSCQANLMRNDTIWGAMSRQFSKVSTVPKKNRLPLAERLISALEAAEGAGGDIRGKQSAAILVVSPTVAPNPWSGRLVDLRVEDFPTPLPELKRLLRLQRGYEWANKGDEFLNAGKFEESLKAYEKAGKFAPDFEELEFWQGVSLVQAKRLKEAKPIFKKVFKKNKDWIQVARSLPKIGLLPNNRWMIRQILSA
jgi:uncharacterized Ntn-hydrolase superfamily protein